MSSGGASAASTKRNKDRSAELLAEAEAKYPDGWDANAQSYDKQLKQSSKNKVFNTATLDHFLFQTFFPQLKSAAAGSSQSDKSAASSQSGNSASAKDVNRRQESAKDVDRRQASQHAVLHRKSPVVHRRENHQIHLALRGKILL